MAERPVVGDTYTATATFTVGGVLTNPTSISLTVTAPDGTATSPTPTNDSTGVYHYDQALSSAGVWSFVFTGTGTAAGVQTSTITVYPVDPQTSYYCTVEEAKDWIRISDTDDDGTIEALVSSASRWIDNYCNRQDHGFWLAPTAIASTYTADNFWIVCVDPIGDTTGLTVKTDEDGDGVFETTWSASDYQLWPVNADGMRPEARPWDEIRAVGSRLFPITYKYYVQHANKVQVTARWGWPQVPAAVKTATLMQASRWFKRRESPEGIVGNPDFGIVRVGYRLDPDIQLLLGEYRRTPAFVG